MERERLVWKVGEVSQVHLITVMMTKRMRPHRKSIIYAKEIEFVAELVAFRYDDWDYEDSR